MRNPAVVFLITIGLALLATFVLMVSALAEDEMVDVTVTMTREKAQACIQYGCTAMTPARLREVYEAAYKAGQESVDNFMQMACRKDDA